nr:CoA transferase [Microbacterium sp. CIAB417]
MTADALPSRLAVSALALASVRAVCDAARDPRVDPSRVDPVRVAAAYRSDRMLRIDGRAPDAWAPLSGFWRTTDGWIRTHGNYPHHARALRRGLALSDAAGADELAQAVADLRTADAVAAVSGAGGLAVPVRAEDPGSDAELRRTGLVETIRLADAPRRGRTPGTGARGIRVLDLTRVIAGPVCTRTLALLGADVLRVDPPDLPELEWQHVDTGHGKRTTVLDARSARFADLLAHADVVVLGYHPAALDRLGLSPAALADRHPGLVIAQLSAWGEAAPGRRGFDSLVQAESGIAMVESPDGEHPGALPAQALDHSAGYLLAAGILRALEEQRATGGTMLVRTSLRRVAAELLGMPRTTGTGPAVDIDPAAHTQRFTIGGREVITVRSAIPGLEFTDPRPWGRDTPAW